MPRPTLSTQQQERRKRWKNLFRNVLAASPRPLGATEIAQVATEILREDLGFDGSVSPSQVSHWRSDPSTGEGLLRAPSTEEQANALAYALASLGAWTDDYQQHTQMEELVAQLGYELLELEELGEFRWRILKKTLGSDIVFFVSAKPGGYTGELEILSDEKARCEWLRFLKEGKRWLVVAGLQADRFSKSVEQRSFSDWPYEFTGYARAVDLALEDLTGDKIDQAAPSLYEQIRGNLGLAEVKVGTNFDRFCNPDSRILLGASVSDRERLHKERWFSELVLVGKTALVGAIQHDDIKLDGTAFGELGEDRLKEVWNYLFNKLSARDEVHFYSLAEPPENQTRESLQTWLQAGLWDGSIFKVQQN